jgi:hypothetical protein
MTPEALAARRERERFSPPATRDPKSVYWSHRLALEALEAKLASLDAAGRGAAACPTDARFSSGTDQRVHLVASAPASCLPMVYRRPDLVDPARPTEPSVLYAWWSGQTCGEWWAKPLPVQNPCGRMLALLNHMDWGLAQGPRLAADRFRDVGVGARPAQQREVAAGSVNRVAGLAAPARHARTAPQPS